MISVFVNLYSFRYPTTLVYMLQNTEYRAGPYLAWYWRTQNFGRVMQRRTLDRTLPARLLLAALRAGMAAQIVAGVSLVAAWYWWDLAAGWQFGLALLLSYPIVWAHAAAIPLVLGRLLIIRPKERKFIRKSAPVFAAHPGIKIAVAGSYGKTSMKELLVTVLGKGKKVAATPANKNVALSHAQFARTLVGDEDVLIIEYGEGKPGDVAKFAKTTQPTHAVITGLAPAHLDRYKTVERAGKDIFSVADYLHDKNVYVNEESPDAKTFIKENHHPYNADGALGWKVKNIELTVGGVSFDLAKGKRTLHLTSALLGKHQVGPLAFVAALALEIGLTEAQVCEGIAETRPFEHRMQPYQLSGAWIIDDTYNGNIEGIRAGLELLKALPAKHKMYVTPGLVDQGRQVKRVHQKLGELIAQANPDTAVLMQNSTTKFIQAGLQAEAYKGVIRVERDPLAFYADLKYFVASGDIVLLQNDWTDNYF
jgi:UDP-N-acetylmuramyl pentapeptide synthase